MTLPRPIPIPGERIEVVRLRRRLVVQYVHNLLTIRHWDGTDLAEARRVQRDVAGQYKAGVCPADIRV